MVTSASAKFDLGLSVVEHRGRDGSAAGLEGVLEYSSDLFDRSSVVVLGERLLRLLEAREGEHFASIDAGLRGHKARHNLAVLYTEQGRAAEAEAQWQAALAAVPAAGERPSPATEV